MPVLEAADRPFSEVDHVGVLIQSDGEQQHAGLLYLQDGVARALHLEFHFRIKDEPADKPFRWAQMNLDEGNLVVLAVLLSRIAAGPIPIPYGFDADGSIFDKDSGALIPPPAGKGLTCATFIIAVLRTYGHEPVDEKTWPNRESDEEWQQKIIGYLENRASEEHVEAIRNDVGSKRFRPDEVIGASTLTSDQWPCEFERARLIADQIVEELS